MAAHIWFWSYDAEYVQLGCFVFPWQGIAMTCNYSLLSRNDLKCKGIFVFLCEIQQLKGWTKQKWTSNTSMISLKVKLYKSSVNQICGNYQPIIMLREPFKIEDTLLPVWKFLHCLYFVGNKTTITIITTTATIRLLLLYYYCYYYYSCYCYYYTGKMILWRQS